MSLTTKRNTSITRALTANVDGAEKTVASMTGQIVPGKAMTLSLVVADAELAKAHAADVAAALDDFAAELRGMARENGLTV